MSQTLILVDKKNKKVGNADYWDCHRGLGKHHRGFVTLLFDSKNRVLLQRRKHILFDGVWDLTAVSHPKHDGNIDQDWQRASDDALKREMGIGHVEVKNVGSFNYFARDGKNSEREYCVLLVGNYDGVYKPNKDVTYESKWADLGKFLADVSKNPSRYAPWVVPAAKLIAKNKSQNSFVVELEKFLGLFEPFKASYFSRKKREYKNLKVSQDFWRDLDEFMEGGKKLRGFLVYLGYKACGGKQLKNILPACLSFELAHSFLLMHDDVIDRSDMRRGKPAIHKKHARRFGEHFGESMAIVWGDLTAFEAFSLVNSAPFKKEVCQEALDFLLKILMETGFGEALDVLGSYSSLSRGDIHLVNELKTARYSVCGPLILGAIFAGSGQVQRRAMEKFGLAAGEAFQLHDDFLGVFGNEKILGKSVLSDMREGKNTLLVYKAKQMANDGQRKIIDKLWGKADADMANLEAVRRVVVDSGAADWLKGEKERLTEAALGHLAGVSRYNNIQEIFRQMAEFIVKRES